jgi:hypothetical protein
MVTRGGISSALTNPETAGKGVLRSTSVQLPKKEATMRLRKGLLLGLLLALAAAGCGGTDDGDDGVATAGGGAGATASASAAPPAMTDEERQVRFAQCMRDNGIDMPDPEINNGRVAMRMPPGVDPQKVQAAMEKCKQYLPNGGEPPKSNPQMLEQQRKFAQCMRDNGITEFPDPDPNGGIRVQTSPGSHMNPGDPAFKAAQEACAKYQPAPRSGEGPGTVTGIQG